ncbi:hypothetical protein QYE76_024769 [Lolium multiflorum]|uniref:CCHC-type domain-containing protein n=1 Tax=Lolium multiflorum TaxID=4521 RepID=A0AAD8RDX5_LOLMU|nr:hypothetical protein QYE76_024769 [Lolium multiflorum]
MIPLSGRVPEAISGSPEMGSAAAASRKVFPGRGSRLGVATEALSNNNNNHNNSHNNNGNRTNNNNHPNGNNNNPNTAPMTGSNTIPINPKDKSTINCYECGVVGHYSNECPKKLAKIAAKTAAPAQNQHRFAARRNQNNNNGRLYYMNAAEAQEAPQTMQTMTSPTSCVPSSLLRRFGTMTSPLTSPAPRGTSGFYKRSGPRPSLSTSVASPPSSHSPIPLPLLELALHHRNLTGVRRASTSATPTIGAVPGAPTTTIESVVVCNIDLHQRSRSPESLLAADPLPPPCPRLPLVDNDDDSPPFDLLLI